MSKRDAFMFAAYLVVIALGVDMMQHERGTFTAGFFQVIVGAGLFGLRAYVLANRARRAVDR